jgi:MFS transporter, DHA3 family, macrolide efflux protein
MGLILGALNLGALVGGVIMSVWGGTRPRIHTILPGIFMMGVSMAILGMAQFPVALGMAMFLMFFPLPFVNASYRSMLQAKVPPDLQGRVFAAQSQMAWLLIPISALLVGPLADQVLEPMVSQPGCEQVAPLVGNTAGAGVGLLFLMVGVGMSLATLILYSAPPIRQAESNLPDYKQKNELVPDEAQEAVPMAS